MVAATSYVVELPFIVDGAGTVQTWLVGTDDWRTAPTDTPANQEVYGALEDPGWFEEEAFAQNRMFGAVRPAFGEIVISNTGLFDVWESYGVAPQPTILRKGRLGDPYPAAWSEVWRAYGYDMVPGMQRIRISQRSRLQMLDTAICTDQFAGTGGIEGTGVAPKPKQLAFGAPGLVPLIPVDLSINLYFVHANATDSYVLAGIWADGYVFDQGDRIPNGALYATMAELLGTAPAANTFRMWGGQATLDTPHATGPVYVRLGSKPKGDVRFGPKGYLQNTVGGPIGPWRWTDLCNRAGLLDVTPSTLATGSLNPEAGNALVEGTQTYLDRMDDVSKLLLTCYGFGPDDRFWVRELRDPDDAADASLYTFTDTNANGFDLEPPQGVDAPVWQVHVNAGRSWPCTVSDTAEASVRDTLTRSPWQSSFTCTADSVRALNRNAVEYTVEIDGHEFRDGGLPAKQAWGNRFMKLAGGRRRCMRLQAGGDHFDEVRTLPLLGKVTVLKDRYRCDTGRNFRIIRRRIDPASQTVELLLWGGDPGPDTCVVGGGALSAGLGGGSVTSQTATKTRLQVGPWVLRAKASLAGGNVRGRLTAGPWALRSRAHIGPADALYSDVLLLINPSGANGSTSFVDRSSYARTMTTAGNAQVQSNAMALDGDGDYVWTNFAYSSLTTANQCLEAWVTLNTVAAGTRALFSNRTTTSDEGLLFQINGDELGFAAWGPTAGTSVVNFGSTTANLSAGVKTHIAAHRIANDWYLTVGGAVVASTTGSGSVMPGSNIYIGRDLPFTSPDHDFDGSVHAIRHTKGTTARYASFPFTPDADPFPEA